MDNSQYYYFPSQSKYNDERMIFFKVRTEYNAIEPSKPRKFCFRSYILLEYWKNWQMRKAMERFFL